MGTRNVISGLFLLVISIAACIMAYRLGFGTGSDPGAGFAAFGIASLLGLMSLYLLIKGAVQAIRKAGPQETVSPILWKKPVLILIVLAAYGVFFNFLGFPLSTFLLMMLLVWAFGRRKLTLALFVSVITTASSYGLFVTALGLPLPLGALWYLFGE
jgi:putative tricarboxylic transport membrane protein